MLVVEGLTCRFGTKAAVDNASFSIAPGGFVGVIGRSGAGKSTLLRMINRLAQPAEGRILYNDVDITALRGKELRQWDFHVPTQAERPFVRGLVFTPDGKQLATANGNTTVYLLECP